MFKVWLEQFKKLVTQIFQLDRSYLFTLVPYLMHIYGWGIFELWFVLDRFTRNIVYSLIDLKLLRFLFYSTSSLNFPYTITLKQLLNLTLF